MATLQIHDIPQDVYEALLRDEDAFDPVQLIREDRDR
jgi:hypothetical protein